MLIARCRRPPGRRDLRQLPCVAIQGVVRQRWRRAHRLGGRPARASERCVHTTNVWLCVPASYAGAGEFFPIVAQDVIGVLRDPKSSGSVQQISLRLLSELLAADTPGMATDASLHTAHCPHVHALTLLRCTHTLVRHQSGWQRGPRYRNGQRAVRRDPSDLWPGQARFVPVRKLPRYSLPDYLGVGLSDLRSGGVDCALLYHSKLASSPVRDPAGVLLEALVAATATDGVRTALNILRTALGRALTKSRRRPVKLCRGNYSPPCPPAAAPSRSRAQRRRCNFTSLARRATSLRAPVRALRAPWRATQATN